MKKLRVIILMFFITVKGFSQCGVVSGYRFEILSGNVGSRIYPEAQFTSGWNAYAYSWKKNGVDIGTGNYLVNNFGGYNDVCLTVKATNPSTGDSCESTYCQIIFNSDYTNLSMYLEFFEMSSLTYTIAVRMCVNNTNFGQFSIDPGDGSPGYSNIAATHTYPDTGTYQVTLTYDPLTGGSLQSISRKLYVGNGLTNFDLYTNLNPSNCLSPSNNFSTSPGYSGGEAHSGGQTPSNWLNYPNCITCDTTISNGVYFPMSFYSPGVQPINYSGYDSLNNQILACNLMPVADCKTLPDTICGTVWVDNDADGIWDAGESIFSDSAKVSISTWISNGNYFSYSDSNGNFRLPIPPAPIYIPVYNLPPNHIVTFPSPSGYNVQFNTSTNHTGFNFGVVDKGVKICGNVFIDVNADSILSAGIDINYSGALISLFNVSLNRYFDVSTDQYGNYCLSLPVGNYIVKAFSNNLDGAFTLPDSILINAATAGNYYGNNFAFQTPFQGGNLGVFLNSGGMPRPGFAYSLTSNITNSGPDTSSGTVVLHYSNALSYVNSTIGGIHNATNKTITWLTYPTQPTSRKYFTANFTVPVSTPLGTVLTSYATVTTDASYTDYDLTNNISYNSNTVIGSFDPNDKLVTPQGVGTGANVLHSQRLYYRINFQNTGTAEAINIIVQDEIDPNLDMNTFRMERASDTYDIIIVDNTITWKFLNILLPDSNSNEPGSHGFIEFSIKAIQGLADGTVVSNDADIYFDFNPPIVTNTVSNTLQTTLTDISEYNIESDIAIFPNPVNNILNINMGNSHSGKKVITIYNKLGEKVYQVVTYENQKEIPMIVSPGVYSIQVRSENGNYTKRVLKL